jgi:hypothetical protein
MHKLVRFKRPEIASMSDVSETLHNLLKTKFKRFKVTDIEASSNPYVEFKISEPHKIVLDSSDINDLSRFAKQTNTHWELKPVDSNSIILMFYLIAAK